MVREYKKWEQRYRWNHGEPKVDRDEDNEIVRML
jgi:hypothetical protein